MGSILSTSSSDSRIGPGVPSELDVATVRDILMGWLPPELVDDILQKAEYWPMIHSSCHSHFEVRSNQPGGTHDASFCCLITPPIPTATMLCTARQQTVDQPTFDPGIEIDIKRKIKYVKFKFTSRDQGWGGDSGLKYPYAGSWTWFNAEIWRPLSTFNTDLRNVGSAVSSLAEIKPMIASPSNEALQAAGYIRVPPPLNNPMIGDEAEGWLVQRNKRANNSIRSHIVIWTDNDEIGYGCQADVKREDLSGSSKLSSSTMPITFCKNVSEIKLTNGGLNEPSLQETHGCGSGAEFVHCLQPGDRIAIIARARYPFWCNRIHGSMSVDIAYNVA